ncbi:MAG: 2'-5' RNA ligase family protein [Fusobacteriaceae bacterium]
MYFIAIIPPDSISEEVLEFKRRAFEKYGVRSSMKSQAHITLIPPFHSSLEDLKDKMEILKKFLIKFEPFEIKLKNFSCFGERTIYIDVIPGDKFFDFYLNMKKSCQEFFKFDIREFSPHITIVNRDIPDGRFQEIWGDFSQREYKREFLADTVALFRYIDGKWEIEERIKLLSLF